ncbi:MAG: VanZ family protein [Candidatus Acidiferrales bacterium]
MENQAFSSTSRGLDAVWSNRFLTLALGGILFLTLYPFRFGFHTPSVSGPPFFLGKSLKNAGFYDAFLNVLLFMPFGFGLAEKLRESGKSRAFVFISSLVAGALLSYSIEFLQIYIPERDSGWEDVFTNTSGTVFGFLLFELVGNVVLHILAACERGLEALLYERRAALILLLYFGLWFGASLPLQHETRLNNWKPDSLLVVGNDASGKDAWTGQIRLLQIWDRAISREDAKSVSSMDGLAVVEPGLRASFAFSSSTPLHDQLAFMPDLVWTPRLSASPVTDPLVLDGSSWLSSKVDVPNLVQDLQRSNQFAFRIVCTPAKTSGVDSRVLSISQPSGVANLTVRQLGTTLVFSFRNEISAKRSQLAWHTPDVFKAGETRDILYSYDGSNLSLYIDGRVQPNRYKLGPGAALAIFVRKIKPAELNGYNYIFYALVFFPGGALLGIAARRLPLNRMASYMIFGAVILVIPLLMELVLVRVSGRVFSPPNVALSVVLVIAGIVWTNADRGKVRSGQ